ncbi:MAG: monomeric [Bacteroidales bacterium]|nr:monomeric [FeFe] hydrogenase [Bacteroidales bacterium]
MAFTTNTNIVRYKLLAKLVGLWKDGKLVERIDYLPIELSPRNSKVLGRCCVHKERAVWKYKSFPLLGFDMWDEVDELKPLSAYAKEAMERTKIKDNIMCVIDEACSSCVSIKYEITSLCKGCVARNCYMNCPKDAVYFDSNGQAKIDHSKCISCGICHKSCPYHAIVYIPIPCEEACPVGAISKDENGYEHIDEDKCIFCGKCMKACPFGAIFEISQIFDILNAIRRGEKVVVVPAPAVLAQYKQPIEKVYGALKAVGFSDVVEVAQGAMTTTEHEAEELLEKLEEGQPFMTTSCCPSYVELVKKHIPEMLPYVSGTKSPMYYTAEMVKKADPNAKVVFLGPCLGKRKEAKGIEFVDYVMSFEEFNAVLIGMGINIDDCEPYVIENESVKEAHGFARTGGVADSVVAYLKERANGLQIVKVADMNKKNIGLLKSYAKRGSANAHFVEVMTCENGCISGPVAFNPDLVSSQQIFNKALAAVKKSYMDENK